MNISIAEIKDSISEFDKELDELLNELFSDGLDSATRYEWGGGNYDNKKEIKEKITTHIKANYLPLSTLKQVIEDERWNGVLDSPTTRKHHVLKGLKIAINDDYADGYNQALSDVLTAITKLGGK